MHKSCRGGRSYCLACASPPNASVAGDSLALLSAADAAGLSVILPAADELPTSESAAADCFAALLMAPPKPLLLAAELF